MAEAVTWITTMAEAVVRAAAPIDGVSWVAATMTEAVAGVTVTATETVVQTTTIERVAGPAAPIDGVSWAAAQGVAAAVASTITARAAAIAAERIDEWITGN